MPNNQMDSDMRRLARDGKKGGWEWILNKENHFRVVAPCGTTVTTVAPRNRHWKVMFVRSVRDWNYPGLR